MTLRHMKIFVQVFQQNSITKAADLLYIAQPSVSLAIKELENHYGIRLFERIGKRIYPTETGKEFYGYALHIVSLFEEMEKKVKDWDSFGVLRIGASITIGTHILPPIVKLYQERFPNLRIEVKVNKWTFVEAGLLDNSIDLGLIENNPEHPEICAIPFAEDSMCAIVAPDHPLSVKTIITAEEMAQYPLLMREKGSAGREILDTYFSFHQPSVRPIWESTSTQAIVKAVTNRLGIAILPYLLVKKDIEEGNVRQVPLALPIHRKLNIIYHKSKYISPNIKEFISLCQTLDKVLQYRYCLCCLEKGKRPGP